MALLPFVVACLVTVVVALTMQRAARPAAAWLAFLGLLVATILAFALPTGSSAIGGVTLEIDGYLRLVAAVGCVTAILMTALAAAVRPGLGPRSGVTPVVPPEVERRAIPVAAVPLAAALALGPAVIALGLAPESAALPAALVGLAALLGLIVLARDESNLSAGRQLFRAVALAAALVVVGAATALGDGTELAGQPVALGTAAVVLAAAVGVRTGAIPFHATVARVVPRAGLVTPFVLVWAALPLVVVAAGVLASGITPATATGLGLERGAIILVAALTLLVAPVVAAVTDDLDHVVAYSIVQDMGLVMLAFAARESVWEPLRTWLLIVAVSKSALVGWSVAMRARFGSVQLRDLHGWALHSPGLAGGLAFVAVATIGVPTFAVAGVRRDIADAVLDEPLASVAFLVGLLAIVPYLRLAAVGLTAPSPAVRRAPAERLRRPQAWIERARAAAAGRSAGRVQTDSTRIAPNAPRGLAEAPGVGRADPAAERAAARVADIARKFAIGAHRSDAGASAIEGRSAAATTGDGRATTTDARATTGNGRATTTDARPPERRRREPRGPRGARLVALRTDLGEAWAINVVPIAAGLVFALGVLSFAVSAGAFGVRGAGEEGAPPPAASPIASPSPSPTESPAASEGG
jgi:NADH:ubiquinone oxidoreductase subunit 2 (subunit N)